MTQIKIHFKIFKSATLPEDLSLKDRIKILQLLCIKIMKGFSQQKPDKSFFFLRQIVMPDSSVYFTIIQHCNMLTMGTMIQNCAWRISSALQYSNDDI
jgi:hypothetical protein